MKIILIALIFTVSTFAFAQVDTLNYRFHNSTKTIVKTTKVKDGEIVKSNLEPETIDDCKPCWLKYYDKDGKLLQEGLSYTDCALGKRTEYYQSGKIKAVRFYKTNDTNDWTNFPCSVADGTWTYYNEDGSIEKTETYTDGNKIK